jgi:hypothetical protein
VSIAHVDCTVHRDVCQAAQVRSPPLPCQPAHNSWGLHGCRHPVSPLLPNWHEAAMQHLTLCKPCGASNLSSRVTAAGPACCLLTGATAPCRLQVQGYPTLKIYHKGAEAKAYRGAGAGCVRRVCETQAERADHSATAAARLLEPTCCTTDCPGDPPTALLPLGLSCQQLMPQQLHHMMPCLDAKALPCSLFCPSACSVSGSKVLCMGAGVRHTLHPTPMLLVLLLPGCPPPPPPPPPHRQPRPGGAGQLCQRGGRGAAHRDHRVKGAIAAAQK